jgi:hypothetical protein
MEDNTMSVQAENHFLGNAMAAGPAARIDRESKPVLLDFSAAPA